MPTALNAIFAYVLAHPEGIEAGAKTLINMFKATTAPTATTTGLVNIGPSPAIEALQAFMNLLPLGLPSLKTDGYLGPKTEAAVLAMLALAKPYLSLLPHA